MNLSFKRFAAALLAFGLLSGASGLCAPAPAAKHDCCAKHGPAAPKTPCSQMSCCRVAVLPAAVADPELKAVAVSLPAVALQAPRAQSEPLPAAPRRGPPDRPEPVRAGRSPPPALLG